MSIGIRSTVQMSVDVTVTSSVVLVTTGLIIPFLANQKRYIHAFIPFITGSTGGIRAQLLVPASGAFFWASLTIANIQTVIQNASAVFANAAAGSTPKVLSVEAMLINGATAGNIDIQVAQNTSDIQTLTVQKGIIDTILF